MSKINRYFYQFETIKEVFVSFKKLVSSKNVSVAKEEKYMKLKIKNPINEKEFFINIPLKEKDLKSELDSIIPYITSLNNRITELEKKVSKLESQFEQYIPIINNYKNEKEKEEKEGENVLSINKTAHYGIKCEKCGINPIIGYRYKCSICNDYNLCENCEIENYETNEHPHNFIKIRNEKKKKR